jgi:hypothetical protein
MLKVWRRDVAAGQCSTVGVVRCVSRVDLYLQRPKSPTPFVSTCIFKGQSHRPPSRRLVLANAKVTDSRREDLLFAKAKVTDSVDALLKAVNAYD